MKKILKLSLIAMFASSSAYSVVGNDPLSSAEGDARINMIRPLTLLQSQSINFGDVAVDGGGVIGMVQVSGAITCHGFRSHSCPATGITGEFSISGKSNTSVAISITANATMTHTDATSLTFYPSLSSTSMTLDGEGKGDLSIGGFISLTGMESAGEYSTNNSGGVPYQINVVY